MNPFSTVSLQAFQFFKNFLIAVGGKERLQLPICFCFVLHQFTIIPWHSTHTTMAPIRRRRKKSPETTKTNLLEYLILSPQKQFEILLLITMYIVHYMYNLSLDYLEHQVNQIHGIHQHTKICMRDSHTKPCGSPYKWQQPSSFGLTNTKRMVTQITRNGTLLGLAA